METETSQGAFIDITVKTIDGQDRLFSVRDNLSVRQFKEKISGSIEIPADTQRLIFQGRVMLDEKVLKDYDLHGKAIHLVQRAPTATVSGAGATSTTTTSTPSTSRSHTPLPTDGSQFDVQIHLGRVHNLPNAREARLRMRQAEFNLRIVNESLGQMERIRENYLRRNPTQVGSQVPHSSLTTDPVTVPRSETRAEDNMDTSSPPEADATNQTESRGQAQQQSTSAPAGDQRAILTASELGEFLGHVMTANERVTSYVRQYRDLLCNEVNYTAGTQECRYAQHIAVGTSEIFHALGHMLHNLSDITVIMAREVPRRAAAFPPAPFPIPGTTSLAVPIHMNVRARQNAAGQRQPPTPAAAATAAGSTPVASASSTVSSSSNPGDGTPSAACMNTSSSTSTQPTSFNLTSAVETSADPAVMMEIFPAGISVVAQEIEDYSDSNSDSAENRTSITVMSSRTLTFPIHAATTPTANPVHPVTAATTTTANPVNPVTAATATTTQAATSSSVTTQSAAPASSEPVSSASVPRTTGSIFTSWSSPSSASFIFGPTANVEIRELPAISGGPLLSPGILNNVVSSILNSHGIHSEHNVQVSLVHPLTSTAEGSPVPSSQVPQLVQQTLENLASGGASNISSPPDLPSLEDLLARFRAAVAAQHPAVTVSNTTAQHPAFTVSNTTAQSDATRSTTASTVAQQLRASFTSPSSVPNSFPRVPNIPNLGSSSSNVGASSSPSTQPTRAQFHFHRGPAAQPRHQHVHTRPNLSGSLRPGLSPRFYVDPFLPCSSVHYGSPSATAAYNTGFARAQQQVPNLSSMVSGMVGNIIDQAGQAAAGNSGTRRSSSSTSANTSSSTSSATGRRTWYSPHPDPEMMFSHLLRSSNSQRVTASVESMAETISQLPADANTVTSGSASASHSWALTDLFARLRRAYEDSAGDVTVIVSLVEALAPHLRLTDLFSLLMGNTRVINQVREPLQEFVRRQLTRYGSMDRLVEAALQDLYPEIHHLQGLITVKDEVDMAQSLHSCLRVHLATIFEVLNSSTTGPDNFGSHMYNLWMKMMAEAIGLCIYCIRDGQTGFSNMVQRYMPRVARGMSPVITIWMTTSLQDICLSFYQNHPVGESDIMKYVVKRQAESGLHRPSVSSPSEHNHSVTGAMPADQSSGLTHTETQAETSPVGSSQSRNPGPMDPVQESQSQLPQIPHAPSDEDPEEGNEIFEDAQESFVSQPLSDARHNAATPVNHAVGTMSGSGVVRNRRSPNDWQSVIPQDWIPVISRDIVRQQDQRPQSPMSDAYLQGLPAKRRRMMSLEHAGEMGNMPIYLPASLTRAARAADVEPISSEENMAQEAADDADLQRELEVEMTRVLASRITTDQDFSSERFPNAKEYFHKSNGH